MDKQTIEAAEAALRDKHFDQNGCRTDDKDWYLNIDGRSSGYDRVRIGTTHAFVDITVPIADLPALLNYQKTADALRKLVADLDELMVESRGVSCLHNGTIITPWRDLTAGGYMQERLSSLGVAHELLAAITPKEGEA